MTSTQQGSPDSPAITLRELAWLFFRLGAIGFGGGMAVVALLEREVVQRRKLIDLEEFLHGVALGQLLGPSAVNASIFVGNRFFGFTGGLACAAAFLAPSITLVILLSWIYFTFHTIPALQTALVGIAPVVIALIISAAWSMGRRAVRSVPTVLLLVVAVALVSLKVNSVLILTLGAASGLLLGKQRLAGDVADGRTPTAPLPALVMGLPQTFTLLPAAAVAAAVGTVPSLATLSLTFLKAGFVFFGGGFVLIPILHQRLVDSLGWLTPQEFLDGVAISNLTPGPIAVLATFTGYHVQGVQGALLATLALFLPAMALMSVLSHFYSRLKDMHHAQNLLAGLSPIVVGMVIGAALLLAPAAVHGAVSVVVIVVALLLLIRFQWHPAFVLALGAAGGMTGVIR